MKIYCSGIGGIGLSAYAALQKHAGHTVLGSDRTENATIADLRSQGITVFLEQDGSRVMEDLDLLVYSEAIPAEAPERKRAQHLGIRQKSYPQAVAALTAGKNLICVCGTHGKSSTTAMAARVLMESGKDPTVVVGTKMRELENRNWRFGKSDLFLLEACEYRRSFLHYSPQIILLTTCDGDHFDYFPSVEDYREAFVEFLRKLPADGVVITYMNDPDCAAVARESGRTVIDADRQPIATLQTPGRHMQENAKLVLALADYLKIPQIEAKKILSGFQGTWRRLEDRGTTKDGVTVFDDYGHHPREIRATVTALREAHPKKRIVCAFQPHTHDRTLKLYDDFLPSFRGVDTLVVSHVYDARSDIEWEHVDLPKFIRDVAEGSHTKALQGGTLAETETLLRTEILRPGDLLLCMGAGDITNLATRMVS